MTALAPWSDVDTAWLAGLVEGEGWIGTTGRRKGASRYRYPSLAVAMTDEDVIARVARLLGVAVVRLGTPSRPGALPVYRATAVGTRASEALARLHPYLGERRSARLAVVLEGAQ